MANLIDDKRLVRELTGTYKSLDTAAMIMMIRQYSQNPAILSAIAQDIDTQLQNMGNLSTEQHTFLQNTLHYLRQTANEQLRQSLPDLNNQDEPAPGF